MIKVMSMSKLMSMSMRSKKRQEKQKDRFKNLFIDKTSGDEALRTAHCIDNEERKDMRQNLEIGMRKLLVVTSH